MPVTRLDGCSSVGRLNKASDTTFARRSPGECASESGRETQPRWVPGVWTKSTIEANEGALRAWCADRLRAARLTRRAFLLSNARGRFGRIPPICPKWRAVLPRRVSRAPSSRGAASRAWRSRGSAAVLYDHRPATLHRLRVAHVRRVALTQVRSTRRGSRGLFRTHARSYAAHIASYTIHTRRADRGWTSTSACEPYMAMRNGSCRLSYVHTSPHTRARARAIPKRP